MKRRNFDHLKCPVAATLSVVGDHWSILILRDLFFGVSRFDEFQKSLGIARNVLSDRLKKLAEEGVVERHEGECGHPEYRLSESGRALRPVLLSMARWGDAHRPRKSGRGRWREAALSSPGGAAAGRRTG